MGLSEKEWNGLLTLACSEVGSEIGSAAATSAKVRTVIFIFVSGTWRTAYSMTDRAKT
jgi:hypothetical protein